MIELTFLKELMLIRQANQKSVIFFFDCPKSVHFPLLTGASELMLM